MIPKVSVIIPTYNRCQSLIKTVESILSGTLPMKDFEIIISDDGSTDETERMIK